jgi:hypothetical protein
MGWQPRIGSNRVLTAAMLAALFCCALALGDTQWQGRPYSVTLAHIQAVGQSSTGSAALTLTHDSQCTLSVSVPQVGDEVLKMGGSSLTTSYKITGIADQDADWLSSSAFLSRSYSIPGSGMEHLTLYVQGAPPPNSAPEPGVYSATIILTVTF